MTPRINPFHQSQSSTNYDTDEVPSTVVTIPKLRKSANAAKNLSFKWSILAICSSMGVQHMSVGNKYEIIEAIIKMQSYLGGILSRSTQQHGSCENFIWIMNQQF